MNEQTKLISLRGARTNNLKSIDLDIPHGQWLGICGFSGSGKSSLAFDTLFAEGQRRYVESFSATARQFLARIERPPADSITGVPPAVAVRNSKSRYGNRSTVGTATETIEYLRLLFCRASAITCFRCALPVRRSSPDSIAELLDTLPASKRLQISFPAERLLQQQATPKSNLASENMLKLLKQNGFARAIIGNATFDKGHSLSGGLSPDWHQAEVVVDRLVAGRAEQRRLIDSLETAYRFGFDTLSIWCQGEIEMPEAVSDVRQLDGETWTRFRFSRNLQCVECGEAFADPDPHLFSYNDPNGACSECEGFGEINYLDESKVVPDPTLSLRKGAIAPWNLPAYRHHLNALFSLADECELPLDAAYSDLTANQRRSIWEGIPGREFGGLNAFFHWLERRKYKMYLRVFLARWKSYRRCDRCQGQRLSARSLSYRIQGQSIADFSALSCTQLAQRCQAIQTQKPHDVSLQAVITQLCMRLEYLQKIGLGYLSLSRPMNSLSRGELQRTSLTASLSSTLVNLLYVIEEPSLGLHPVDWPAMLQAIQRLAVRGNSIVMIDHERQFLKFADRLVELGPESGIRAGSIIFDGKPDQIVRHESSPTGKVWRGERAQPLAPSKTKPSTRRQLLRLQGASGLHLKHITVEFPLNCLCVVCGPSGAGKSTLIEKTLLPGVAQKLEQLAGLPLAFEELSGADQIENVAWLDHSKLPRTSRSNPVTYIKAFDEIRTVFAETVDAKSQNMNAGHFSFNVDGGRCPKCEGQGVLQIDMQFLADVRVICEDCNGTRFRTNVLQVKYRGRNIAEVLKMTVGEAFIFFRGQRKLQKSLKTLIDVGLDYLQLGQPAETLSGGEGQRLKLAAMVNAKSRSRTLFLLDHPCAGLHPCDILRLYDSLQNLIAVGHSIILIDHRPQMLAYADWLIELGPGAEAAGGRLVASGTPRELAERQETPTGLALREYFGKGLSHGE